MVLDGNRVIAPGRQTWTISPYIAVCGPCPNLLLQMTSPSPTFKDGGWKPSGRVVASIPHHPSRSGGTHATQGLGPKQPNTGWRMRTPNRIQDWLPRCRKGQCHIGPWRDTSLGESCDCSTSRTVGNGTVEPRLETPCGGIRLTGNQRVQIMAIPIQRDHTHRWVYPMYLDHAHVPASYPQTRRRKRWINEYQIQYSLPTRPVGRRHRYGRNLWL